MRASPNTADPVRAALDIWAFHAMVDPAAHGGDLCDASDVTEVFSARVNPAFVT
jgi:hypothetical protein